MLSSLPNKSLSKYTEWVLLGFSIFYYQFVAISNNFKHKECEQNTHLVKYEE